MEEFNSFVSIPIEKKPQTQFSVFFRTPLNYGIQKKQLKNEQDCSYQGKTLNFLTAF